MPTDDSGPMTPEERDALKKSRAKDASWVEFIVYVMNDKLGVKIPLCGLCGNCGMVDTTTTAKWDGKSVGIKKFCICPNGRALKKDF